MVKTSSIPALDRFCHQYMQLDQTPEYPDGAILREEAVQDELHRRLFSKDALAFPPPVRYQMRVLKKLLGILERSIQDWDKHVREFLKRNYRLSHPPSDRTVPGPCPSCSGCVGRSDVEAGRDGFAPSAVSNGRVQAKEPCLVLSLSARPY